MMDDSLLELYESALKGVERDKKREERLKLKYKKLSTSPNFDDRDLNIKVEEYKKKHPNFKNERFIDEVNELKGTYTIIGQNWWHMPIKDMLKILNRMRTNANKLQNLINNIDSENYE